MPRQPEPADRRAQGAHGLRRASSSATGTRTARSGLHQRPTARRRSTPGSTCTWRPTAGRALYDSLLPQAKAGEIPMARLDDAVRRILRVKAKLGLFDGQAVRTGLRASRTCSARPTTARWRARRCAKSLVLLKNEGGAAAQAGRQGAGRGRRAPTISQAGGRLDDQLAGHRTQQCRLPNGRTSSCGAFATRSRPRGGAATLVAPTAASRPSPTSRSWCSARSLMPSSRATSPTLDYQPSDPTDLALLKKLKARACRWCRCSCRAARCRVDPEINASDAFVAAWLPGTQGGGIADVLVGGTHDFIGTLPFAWPAERARRSPRPCSRAAMA